MARRTSNRPPREEPSEPTGQPDPVLTDDIEVDLESPLADAKPNGNGAAPPESEIEVDTGAPPLVQEDEEKAAMRRRLQELEAAENVSRQREAQALQALNQWQQRDQQSQAKISQSQWNAAKAEYDGTLNGIAAANSEIGALKEQVRQAGIEGNWEVIAEAQAQIGNLSYDLRSLEARKGQLEAWSQQVRQQAQQRPKQQQPQQQPRQQQPQQQQDPVEAAIAPLPERAKVWLRAHREYMTDAEKNADLQAAHWKAKRDAGGEFTDAYFERMEERLGLREGGQVRSQSTPSTQSRTSVSAPPTREAPSMSTGRSPTPTKVTLNAEERQVAAQIAESRKMTQAEAEREYAKQKIKMMKEKTT